MLGFGPAAPPPWAAKGPGRADPKKIGGDAAVRRAAPAGTRISANVHWPGAGPQRQPPTTRPRRTEPRTA